MLACKRCRGSHTFDVLAGALNDVHCHYRIWGKVIRTTTDSGSIFGKVYNIFVEQNQSEVAESDQQTNMTNLMSNTKTY